MNRQYADPHDRGTRDLINACAARDMRLARREGALLIGQTKRGLVNLRYDAPHQVYTLTSAAGLGQFAIGKAAIIRQALADLYIIY